MYVCAIVTHHRACDVGRCRTHLISRVPDTYCACRVYMHSDPPITLVLNQYAAADQPLHMKEVAGNNIEKWATITENRKNEHLVPKRKSTSVIWNYFGYKKEDFDQTFVLCQQCLASVSQHGDWKFWEGASTHEWVHMKYAYNFKCSITNVQSKSKPNMTCWWEFCHFRARPFGLHFFFFSGTKAAWLGTKTTK